MSTRLGSSDSRPAEVPNQASPSEKGDRVGSALPQKNRSSRKRQLRPGNDPNASSQHPRRKALYQRWWVWVLLGLGATTTGGVITVYGVLQAVEQDLPDTKDVLTYVRNGTLTIKAADGTILQQLGPATREKLRLEQIPPRLSEAFIASEDDEFYIHNGVDYRAILRATMRNIAAGEVVEGGSTITQQLARIVFLDQERSFERKLREAMLAQKIERELDKQQVLEQYLNLVYLGSGAYGVADAAWIYFSKSVDDLTLSEIATIAGLPPAPSVYSPLVSPEIARQRRDIVLSRMVAAGYITPAERSEAIAEPLELKPSLPRNLYSSVPYFTSYIQEQLPQYVSPEDLELGGLTVETTLNPAWQEAAQETVRNSIENYGPGQGFEQAALVAIDPNTGEIKALVGGDDFNESQFNRATQAQRQPGSTFKTLVYTTAIAAGFSPQKTYVDAKFVVDGYEPQNYSRRYEGTVSIRDALVSSVNIVAVKVLIDVGFDPVIAMAKRMGIHSDLSPTYSLALGASEVNLLELTSAYGTLAAEGNHIEPHGITRILDRNGAVLYEADFQPERAVDANTAAIMTWMLQGVVTEGTGGRARLGRPVAGKTGTSERRRDLWFVGYIPQLVTGVWLGNDDSHPTWGASSTAARTWHNFMAEVVEGMPVESFPELPQLSGRRGSIQAEPVKPRRTSASRSSEDENQREDRQRGSENSESQQEERPRSESRDTSSGNNADESTPQAVEDSAPLVEEPVSPPEPEAPPPEPVSEPAPPAAEAPPASDPVVVPVEPAPPPPEPASP